MNTRSKSSSIMLVLMVLICCYQFTWAGIAVKQVKAKNSTNVLKEVTPTTKHPKLIQKVKTTTTTLKPEVETVKPIEEEGLDGRNAFINNQYVADEDPITDDTPPLYEMLQQQMETVLSNTGNNVQVYPDTPQLKQIMDDRDDNEVSKQKPPGKPIFSYDMHQFDEYDEEDTGVEDTTDTEEQPDNCEDTQESLTDNEEATNYAGVSPQTSVSSQNLLQNSYEQSASSQNPQQNNPGQNSYGSSNYAVQTNSNQESSYNNYGQTNEPIQSPQAHSSQDSYGQSITSNPQQIMHKLPQHSHDQSKTKPLTGKYQSNQSQKSPHNNDRNTKPLEHTNQKPSNSNEKSKIQQSTKPHRHSSKSPQNSQKPNKTPVQNSDSTQNKPTDSKKTTQNNNKIVNNGNSLSPSVPNSTYGNFNPTLSSTPNSSYGNSNLIHLSPANPSDDSFNPTSSNPSFDNTNPSSSLHPNSSYGSFNSSPLSPLNTLYDNSNPALSSPFSTIYETNKFPNNDQKRRLTFKTVSSSTQFVSTPLADLMFKFSIGMSKPSSSVNDNVNQAQIYNKNYLEKS